VLAYFRTWFKCKADMTAARRISFVPDLTSSGTDDSLFISC
jgi:hypothetical protein